MPDNIPYYVVNEPYELYYKNEASAFPVGAHTHNAAEIYLTLTDLPDALLNDTVSSIRRGTLIIIPPFCVHQLYHEKDVIYERYIMNIDIAWLDNILYGNKDFTEALKHSDRPLILPLSDRVLVTLTAALNHLLPVIKEKTIKSTAEFFSTLSILNSAVQDARRNTSFDSIIITKSQKTVNDIIAYINNHLEENITLSEISDYFFLNKDYLARLFMKHTHTSIGRYISIQRIAKSQEYLRSGMSVSEVSEKMGFSSYAYFFKVFQKMTGISPSQYKNTLQSQRND